MLEHIMKTNSHAQTFITFSLIFCYKHKCKCLQFFETPKCKMVVIKFCVNSIFFFFSILGNLLLGRKAMTNLDSILKSRDILLLTKVRYGFSSSHIQMWALDHKEGWTLKNWCFQIVVLEKTLESPLDCKEIKPVNPKGNQPWIFIGSTHAEAPILWPPDEKSWLTGKGPDAEKDWRPK